MLVHFFNVKETPPSPFITFQVQVRLNSRQPTKRKETLETFLLTTKYYPLLFTSIPQCSSGSLQKRKEETLEIFLLITKYYPPPLFTSIQQSPVRSVRPATYKKKLRNIRNVSINNKILLTLLFTSIPQCSSGSLQKRKKKRQKRFY